MEADFAVHEEPAACPTPPVTERRRGPRQRPRKELLGHESIEMTLRYSHLSPDVKRVAVRLLDGPPGISSGNLTATEPED